MSTEQCTIPEQIGTLPDNCPSLSVTLALGQVLHAHNRVVDVDFAALNQVMQDRGIPSENFDQVEMEIDKQHTRGLKGEAWLEHGIETYHVSIFPTTLQTRGLHTQHLQKTVVHELQHVSDYIAGDYVHKDVGHAYRQNRVQKLRHHVGQLGVTASVGVALPELFQASYDLLRDNPALQTPLGIGAVGSAPLALLGAAYSLSAQTLYRTEALEKRAFKAARKTHGDYDNVITFRRASSS